jgi:hypothetical protein
VGRADANVDGSRLGTCFAGLTAHGQTGGDSHVPTYEYGRIKKLAENLEKAGVARDAIDQIMEGGDTIRKGAKPEKKAEWMKGAMHRMDRLLDRDTRRAVREGCACCLGGKRLKISKKIAKENDTLDERIAAANGEPFVFGHSVTKEEDGRILVRFAPQGQAEYRCVCLRQAKAPISMTYCYCCGGHIKHHLQIALGRELVCTPRSSALSSGGKRPCAFLYSFADG